MQTSKLLGNRRKTYILDVICNKFYFGEERKLLGQCSGQGRFISQHLEQKVYLSISSLFRKEKAGWLRKCLFKYSTEVRFVLEILENSKVIASELSQKWITPLGNPLGQNRRPLNYVVFLLITLADSVPFLIHLRNYTCFNFHPQSIPCLQTYSLGFFLK